MSLELLFNGANVFVLPFWALMIVLPNWSVTRTVMRSVLPFAALALLYLYFFIGGISAETLESFSSAGLSDIARLFSDEQVAATGWVHFLVMDLFVGRWIYWDSQNAGIWSRHSLALCFFAGPLGLLSHLITRWIFQKFFATPAPSTSSTDEVNPTPSSATPS